MTHLHSRLAYGALAAGILLIILLLVLLWRRRRGGDNYELRWKEVQRLLGHKATWKDAIVSADTLLDELLKNKHFKGKTMGERLVAAQHHITANDMVWFSHKLRNKIVYESLEVSKNDVKQALLGFFKAMKDLGAFNKHDQE